eukprot:SAG31_NODE_1135_length_9735_cov_4.098900_2_plen_382_part_00
MTEQVVDGAMDPPKPICTFGAFKRRGQKRQKAKNPSAAEEADEGNESAVVKKEEKTKPGVQRLHKRPKAAQDEDVFGFQYSANSSLMSTNTQDDATRTISIDDPNAPGMSAGSKAFRGPMRAPTAVRTTLRIDYQPDLCKDYKDTGYCGYGDACKFMHDRGDYLSGWQMEKQWEAKQAQRRKDFMEGAADNESEIDPRESAKKKAEDELPWGCFICRGPFVNAIETKCKHYFCEQCALKRYGVEKKTSCFICMEPTLGIFNVAKVLRSKETEERKIAVQVAPKFGLEASVSTAFIFAKAEKNLGEVEGKTTLNKLEWIAEKLGMKELQQSAEAKQQQAEADDAQAAEAAIEKRQKAWADLPNNVTWRYGGSGLDSKYASGL